MDPDELADALDARAPQQPQGGDNDMSWDGRTATNPQTGERIIWRGNRRTGSFRALNYENADPQSRERVQNVDNLYSIGSRTLPQARQFMQQNFEAPTGGIQNTLPPGFRRSIAAAVRPQMFSDADAQAALSNQMVGSNWQPGTTGMMNTATEMAQVRSRFPSPEAQGPANMQTYLNMVEEVAVQGAAVRSMRQWLQNRPNLEGWEQSFAAEQRQVRQRARAAAQREMSDMQRPGSSTGRMVGQSARPRPGHVEDGYRFRGGDPGDRRNWERVR
jgi:hypothetical protein